MENHLSSGTVSKALVAAAALALPACGPSYPQVTVQGHLLQIMDQSYGTTGGGSGYCGALDSRGQYQLVISDIPSLCSSIPATKPDNKTIFHSSENNVLRIVMSNQVDVIKKNPPTSVLKVANTYNCTSNRDGAQAVAFFSHNPAGGIAYDVNVEADSGTISINYFESPANMTGSFDLTFAGEHVTGSINATLCPTLAPGLGK